MKAARIGACLLLALGSPCCMTSVRTPYPSTWPGVQADAKSRCPDLSGTYENFGLTLDETRALEKGKGPLRTALGIPDRTRRHGS